MIREFVEAVTAVLVARSVTATVHLGGEHIFEQESPPRIVWVPIGGASTSQRTGAAGSSSNPRTLRVRQLRLDAHCWGADFDSAESLLNEVVSAVHSVRGPTGWQFTGEEWPETNAEVIALGRVVIAQFTLDIPVTDQPKTTVTIASVETDVAVEA